MNIERKKKPIAMKVFEGISKVPIWVWMFILGITAVFSSFYQITLVANSYVSVFNVLSSKVFFAIMAVSVAVVFPFLIRLFTRVDYACASRIYFRKTVYVPDYNLRRLPIPYNDFVRIILFIYAILNVVKGCLYLVVIAYPFTVYLMKLPEFLIKIALFVFATFMIKPFLAPWQYKDTFFSLGLPTAILLIISIWVGV